MLYRGSPFLGTNMRYYKTITRGLAATVALGLLTGCAVQQPVSSNQAEDSIGASQTIASTETDSSWEAVSETQTTETEESTEIETEEVAETDTKEEQARENGRIIAIDPGHQAPDIDMSAQEPIGPGATETKAKATAGTQGTYTGLEEYKLNLDISLLLRDLLEQEGHTVVLARTNNETAISNAERAQMAVNAGADIYVRIHANGNPDSSVSGACALIASQSNPYVGSMYETNYALADDILTAYCEETGIDNDGIVLRDDLTGLNWAGTMPAMLLEMGFMTNRSDDEQMADPAFQNRMATGIAKGIDQYFASEQTEQTVSESDNVANTENRSTELQNLLIDEITTHDANGGNEISVYAGSADGATEASYNEQKRQAASLIKLFIAGAVFENWSNVAAQEMTSDETNTLLKRMITVSDNDAANTLTTRLGNGDTAQGMAVVNQYCVNHGFTDTTMDRLLLAPNTNGDNYTSVRDCAEFLRLMYSGKLAGSDQILGLLKQQQRRSKIPAGVPTGVTVANKTGELLTVENDAAIVFTKSGDYILTVMSEGLPDTAAERQLIVDISGKVYSFFAD